MQEEQGEERVVSYRAPRAPSPRPVPAPAGEVAAALAKYMLDGRTAYYVCLACRRPVGSLLAWRRHTAAGGHLAKAAGRREGEVARVGASPSVLNLFGDSANHCLACAADLPSNQALYQHEQLEQHKAAVRVVFP